MGKNHQASQSDGAYFSRFIHSAGSAPVSLCLFLLHGLAKTRRIIEPGANSFRCRKLQSRKITFPGLVFRYMGKSVKPPLAIWGISAALSLFGIVTGALFGGSLAGYFSGLLGTVLAFLSLYINRKRQMNRNYDHSFPWFQMATSTAYSFGVVATLLHIVRYAIELGNA